MTQAEQKPATKNRPVQDFAVTKFRPAVSAVFPQQSAFGKDFSVLCGYIANSQASSSLLSKEKLTTGVYGT